MAHCLGHLLRQRVSPLPLARVEAELHPVELGEDVVRKIELAVAADVDLRAAQDAKRRELLVRGGDLLRLPAQVVCVEPGHDAHVLRVVADRDVVVAELARGSAHLEHRGLPVRPSRMAMEVAPDVRELDERRRLAPERLLAQLGRTPWDSERGVDAFFVRGVGDRLERRNVRRRTRGAHELAAEPRRVCDDELDGHSLHGHAERAPLVAFDHGDDCRQPLEAVQHLVGTRRRRDDREIE